MTSLHQPTGQTHTILLIEDNPGDARLVEEACEEAGLENALRVVPTSEDGFAFLRREADYMDAPRPDLILLDWNLPGTDGSEFLTELMADADLRHIPVLVLTGSPTDQTLRDAYHNHANACLPKPTDPDGFIEKIRTVKLFWLSTASLPPTSHDDPNMTDEAS